MSRFFDKNSDLLLSIFIIAAVLALNFTAHSSVSDAMASQKQTPILCIKTDRSVISITFDVKSGCDTERIMKELGEYKASFFVSRRFLEQNPEKVKALISGGHSVGILESSLKGKSREKMLDTLTQDIRLFSEKTDCTCRLVRFENNIYDGKSINIAFTLGLYPIQWSADSTADNFSQGDIVFANCTDSISELINKIKKDGCEPAAVDDIIIKNPYYVDINGVMQSGVI